MTRKEAIKILKSINPFNAVTVKRGDYEIKQALEMAIDSLETDEAYQLEYEVSTQPSIDDFIEYAERKFGVKVSVKKSDDPDTVEKLFGEKVIDKSDEFEEWKLNEDKDCYLRIGDIVERFKEIDEHYNHSPWTLIQIFSNLNILQRVECKAEDITFKDDNAVSRLSVRDIIYANAYELEYPDSTSEYVVNRDELIKYLMELPTTKNDLGVDAVSRQAVLDLMIQKWGENFSGDSAMQESIDAIRVLPSVTSQKPRCKECKWWKDSDGEYRRGCGAESKCPINRREVFEGNGYCYMFEPQESEDKE